MSTATSAAAAWLGSRRALQKWTCLARRLRAARLGCGAGDRVFVAADSAVVKRRFAAALRTAFPGVAVGYFDGLAPPIYDTWLKAEPTPGEWLLLAAAAADWLALARSAHVLGLKGTTTGLALPSSFARTATLAFSPATFENLQRLVWSRGDRRVACCVWKDDNMAMVQLGRMYQNGSGVKLDKKKADRLYRMAADRGDAIGQNKIGCILYSDSESEEKFEEAFRFYALSADQGYTPGETNLGCCYRDGAGTEVDLGKARYWFERAAAKGHERAMKNLADLDARV